MDALSDVLAGMVGEGRVKTRIASRRIAPDESRARP